jgi:hypothetical protein
LLGLLNAWLIGKAALLRERTGGRLALGIFGRKRIPCGRISRG